MAPFTSTFRTVRLCHPPGSANVKRNTWFAALPDAGFTETAAGRGMSGEVAYCRLIPLASVKAAPFKLYCTAYRSEILG